MKRKHSVLLPGFKTWKCNDLASPACPNKILKIKTLLKQAANNIPGFMWLIRWLLYNDIYISYLLWTALHVKQLSYYFPPKQDIWTKLDEVFSCQGIVVSVRQPVISVLRFSIQPCSSTFRVFMEASSQIMFYKRYFVFELMLKFSLDGCSEGRHAYSWCDRDGCRWSALATPKGSMRNFSVKK